MVIRAQYEGKVYEFPDGVTEAEITEFIDSQQPKGAADVVKSAGAGAVRGLAGLAGLPGDVSRGMRWAAEQTGRLFGSPVDQDYIEGKGRRDLALTPQSDEIVGAIERAAGPLHKPQTTAGKYADTMAQFAAGSLGPGGVVRNAVRYGAAPGAAVESAGQLTEGTWLEPYARTATGLLALGAASRVGRPSTAERMMSDGMRSLTPSQQAAVEQLRADAAARGIQLTLPEAVQQVTNSGTTLGNLQRVVEGSQGGAEVMRPYMARRPGQIQGAFDRQMDEVAAIPMTPSSVGPRAAEAAERVFEGTRQSINNRTQPLYDAARNDLVPERTLRRMHRDIPGFTETLAAVRADPHLNARIAGLPDRSVIVLDQVKQQLQGASENAARITNPNRNMTVSSSQAASATATRRAGRLASRPYRRALEEQERLRKAELQPLREGQIGQIAEAGNTRAAANALLPENPLPGSAAETGRTVRALAGEDLRATRNLIRQRLESGYQTAARDVQSGASEFAGAAARKKLYGDRQLRRNIRSALRELPNGSQLASGMDRLMEIFQATGRRQQIGSQTEFNRLITDQLSGGRAGVDAAMSTISRVNPLNFVRDRYRQWMIGRNSGELARLMTDPASQQRLLELANLPRGDARARVLQAAIIADMIEGE